MSNSIQKVVNAVLTAGMVAGLGWLWQVNAQIAVIQTQLETTNARTAEILQVLDTIAPRTVR